MSLFAKLKDFFKRLFRRRPNSQESQSTATDLIIQEVDVPEQSTLEQFKMHNIVFEKLNYLEQYIKLFSLNFPKEYAYYLNIIQSYREEYEAELKKYSDGFLGEITFAIDPECESNRLISVANLENEIQNFVEFDVNYSVYREKFSKLCHKLIQFYNALLDTTKEISTVVAQLENAVDSMYNLVSNVNTFRFFKTDSRKKDAILNYVIYGEYIFFKSSLRCSLTQHLGDYKEKLSKFCGLFVSSEYDRLIFKFFIEDLEHYQMFITTKFNQNKMYDHILRCCQSLQNRLNNYKAAFNDSSFFTELIQFENTVDNFSENCGMEYIIPLSDTLEPSATREITVSIKDTAVSVLNLIDCGKSRILCKVISNFKKDISWREFFFLCKIFELYKDVIEVVRDTVFSFVSTKFCKLSTKYSQYSDTFIQAEKEKLLNYHGSKSKRYVLLFNIEKEYMSAVICELKQLHLDFFVSDDKVYLNHSYFNGFKNLEQNFGQYKLLEELL